MGEPILSSSTKLGEPFVLDLGRVAVCLDVIERGEPRPRRGRVRLPAIAGPAALSEGAQREQRSSHRRSGCFESVVGCSKGRAHMRRVRICERELHFESIELKEQLARTHGSATRPLCLCRSPGVPMYVARVSSRHILKRMPETGPDHDPSCDSYEAPYELSGFGHVAGSAIRENAEDGVTVLRLDFSLSKAGLKKASAQWDASEAGAAKTDGSKLSLRALLHYLWDQAEFNRWRPGMAGKRNWAVIRKYLLEAAEGKTTKAAPLLDRLFIPETFQSEREDEIAQRRIAFMNRAVSAESNRRPLFLLIGEVKEIAPARYGHKLVVRHLPKFPFMLNEDIHRRMTVKFASDLSLWSVLSEGRLIAIATFGLDQAGVAQIDAVSLMVVNENWIPVEHSHDATLLDALTRKRSSFLKGLRYNLSIKEPLVSVLLREDAAGPVAMYIVPAEADQAYRETLAELTAKSGIASWVWSAAEGSMPALPL